MADFSLEIRELAKLVLTNAELLTRMQQLHPGANRHDFTHAAFRAVVDMSYDDAELGYRIYDFALALRRAD